MILIGGKALLQYGSSRSTDDTDFLIFDQNKNLFEKDSQKNVDFINAAKSDFFKEIYEAEKGNEIATPQALLELKAFAFVQHCQNFKFQKADDAEYDIKYLVRNFGVSLKILPKYLAKSELKEIQKIIDLTK